MTKPDTLPKSRQASLTACPKCGANEFYLPRSVDRQQYHWTVTELKHRTQYTLSMAKHWNLECVECGDKSLKIELSTSRITARQTTGGQVKKKK